MKKVLLALFIFTGILSAQAQSDCTPDTTIKEAGMYPRNLPDAKVGLSYSEVIQFKFPKDTNFGGVTIPIDSVRLVSVDSLPKGFTFLCNSNDRCSYKGGANGCVSVKGSPTEDIIGDYMIIINGEGYAKFGGIPITQKFSQHVELKVTSATSFYTAKKSAVKTFEVSQNQPNPFSRTTQIEYSSPNVQAVSFKVYDIVGHMVYTKESTANTGNNTISFERNNLKSGIYFYSLQCGNKVITKKMTIRD
jgi:hypothetical protein